MGKGRTPCCEKGRVKKGPWSQDEDLKLISFIQRHGHSNWRSLPKLAGLARCGKSCRLRWVNYLRPDVKRGSLTPDEEETIIRLQSLLGNKWSKIASHLPGRTDNEIKNIWNTHLKKRSTINTKSSHQDNDKVSYEPVSHDCGGQGLAISLSPKGDGATELSSFNCMALETNLVGLWESLLLDASNEGDRFNLNNNNPYGVSHGKQACMVIEGDASASNQNKDLLVGGDHSWSFGVLDDYESGKINMDTTAAAVGCSQEFVSEHISKTSQLEAFDNNIKSYLETMAWPSSPNCYNFSGF